MNKFKNIQDLLLLSHNENTKEFVLLHDCFQLKNPDFSYELYYKFDLDDMGQADCKAEFWIEKADLPRLADVLQIPPVIRCRQRSLCDGLEGLCLLLRWTSYPCWYSDIIPRLPRPASVLSLISNYTMPEIGCRFLNFFLSTDDFSTCKQNNGSLLNVQDNWIRHQFFLHFLHHWSLIYAFASLFPDC